MLLQRAAKFTDSPAIVDGDKVSTYADLLSSSARVAAALLAGRRDLAEARVAFLVPPSFDYVAAQWGIWRAGGVAVPIGLSHPLAEIEYVVSDSEAETILVSQSLLHRLGHLVEESGIRLLTIEEAMATDEAELPEVASDRRAMILYTSGTTSRPKGVVTTHDNIAAQIESLVTAWEWSADDSILHFLPLHHIHGIINVLCCALWSGARCEFLRSFDARDVLRRLAKGNRTLFMAVPTIYSKLIAAWQELSPQAQAGVYQGCQKLRLMVSGSAALPVRTMEKWGEISGHTLLERYGMTEIGMALSNPLHGQRVAGHVGQPLPGVEVRRVDEQGNVLLQDDIPGEIEVRGKGVFLEYWNRPEITAASFHDGFFRTGDVAVVENGHYRILGRTSVDIIKTGGYKVSALEIEEVLRTHPSIRDCAVVGVPDEEWGECVAACVIAEGNEPLELQALRSWSKQRLAAYKAPTKLKIVDDLPRNAMGKVQKPAVKELFVS